MMKCNKCGASNPEDARFCRDCGNSLLIQAEQKDKENHVAREGRIQQQTNILDKKTSEPNSNKKEPPPRKEASKRNDAVCPFCQAPECQPMQKSTMESKTTGYKWGSGCCGMFLLGPFGLLCGLCGTGSKTKTTSELWWSCMKCGKQHIALKDALNKWDTTIASIPLVGLSTGITAAVIQVFLKLFMPWLLGTGFLGGLITSVFVFVIPLILAVVSTIMSVAQLESNVSDELGEPIDSYLTEEQNNREKKMGLIAIAIAVVITLVCLPVSV